MGLWTGVTPSGRADMEAVEGWHVKGLYQHQVFCYPPIPGKEEVAPYKLI